MSNHVVTTSVTKTKFSILGGYAPALWLARAATVFAVFAPTSFAQPGPFPGFTAGNLVVSRSVYTGDSSTVVVGQPLPPVCPSTAACGTGKASDSGMYPSTAYTNNVGNNDTGDGSVGV